MLSSLCWSNGCKMVPPTVPKSAPGILNQSLAFSAPTPPAAVIRSAGYICALLMPTFAFAITRSSSRLRTSGRRRTISMGTLVESCSGNLISSSMVRPCCIPGNSPASTCSAFSCNMISFSSCGISSATASRCASAC
ncbi:hypothetical protein D3C81_1041520 [compost metagenome]